MQLKPFDIPEPTSDQSKRIITMSYTKQIIEITSEIKTVALRIADLEDEREAWTDRKRGKSFYIGGKPCKVFQQDGTVDPRIEGVQREAISLHDAEIIKAKGLIEGLRYKLVRAAKNGGQA